CRGVGMDKLAEAGERDGKGGKRHRAPDAPAAVTLPFVNHEIGLVHELEGEDAVLQIGSDAVMTVPPNERDDGVLEQRVMSFLGQQFARASLRPTSVEHIARDRIRDAVMNSAKQPVMIESNEDDL